MIRIEFTGDARTVRHEMTEFLGFGPALDQPATSTVTPVESNPLPATADPVETKKPRAPKKSAGGKDESAPSESSSPSPEPEAQPQPSTDTGTAPVTAGSSSTDGAPVGEVTPEALRAKCTEFGMKNPEGLKELLIQFGTAEGKFSGVPVEKYGAMMVRLDELLG